MVWHLPTILPLSVASPRLLKLVIRSRLLSMLHHHGPVLEGSNFLGEKTKAIRFCRLRRVEEIPTLFLNYSILPYEDSVKYLGITFDRKLTFGIHVNEVVCSVKLRLNILKVVSGFNWGADRTCLLRICQALCLSKIDYGCQVYGSACQTTLQKLDIVHNTALRICTGIQDVSC